MVQICSLYSVHVFMCGTQIPQTGNQYIVVAVPFDTVGVAVPFGTVGVAVPFDTVGVAVPFGIVGVAMHLAENHN